MADIVTREDFELPDKIEGISEESFWKLLDWKQGSGRIKSKVKGKFEHKLYASTGWTDDNRPEELREDDVEIGDIKFRIKTKPTTKTPSWSEVITRFGEYLDFLQEQRGVEEVYRRGVRTFGDEFFVDILVLQEKLERDRTQILQGKEGVEQTNLGLVNTDGNIIKPSPDLAPVRLSIGLDVDYTELTENNANVYWSALNFLKAWDASAKAFKDEVKEDSLRVLGGEPDKPIAVRYPFRNVVFYHQLEPRERISYVNVFEALMKPVPKTIRKGGKIGDLHKLRMYAEDYKDLLLEKELIDNEWIEDYQPRIESDGRIFIRLTGIRKRLAQYSKGSPFLEQNFYVRPR